MVNLVHSLSKSFQHLAQGRVRSPSFAIEKPIMASTGRPRVRDSRSRPIISRYTDHIEQIPTSRKSTSKPSVLDVELESYPILQHAFDIAPALRGSKKPSSVKHKPVVIDLTQDDDDDTLPYKYPHFRIGQHFTPNYPPFPYNVGANPNGRIVVRNPNRTLPRPSPRRVETGKIWLPPPHSNYPDDPSDKSEPIHPPLPYYDNRKHQPTFVPLLLANHPTQAQLIFPWLPKDQGQGSSNQKIPAPLGQLSLYPNSPLHRSPLTDTPTFHPAFNHSGMPYLPKSTSQHTPAPVRLDDETHIRAICTWRKFGMSFEEIAAEVRKTGFEEADEERVRGVCESEEVVGRFGC